MTTRPEPRSAGYRYPSEIITTAVWLHFRFPLSLRHRQVVEVKPDEGRADIGIGGISRGLRRQPGTCDLSPGRERQGSGGSVFGSGAVVSMEVKEVGDRIVDGKEALDLSG